MIPKRLVYLAYDLLFLNKYEEAYAIVVKYEPILPNDKDLRLIAGYVHTHYSQLPEAVADFNKAIELGSECSHFVCEPRLCVERFERSHARVPGF